MAPAVSHEDGQPGGFTQDVQVHVLEWVKLNTPKGSSYPGIHQPPADPPMQTIFPSCPGPRKTPSQEGPGRGLPTLLTPSLLARTTSSTGILQHHFEPPAPTPSERKFKSRGLVKPWGWEDGERRDRDHFMVPAHTHLFGVLTTKRHTPTSTRL